MYGSAVDMCLMGEIGEDGRAIGCEGRSGGVPYKGASVQRFLMLARLGGDSQVSRQGLHGPGSAEENSAATLVLFEFCRQRFVVDPERLGGFSFVAATGFQYPFNMQAFDLVEGQVCLVVGRWCR